MLQNFAQLDLPVTGGENNDKITLPTFALVVEMLRTLMSVFLFNFFSGKHNKLFRVGPNYRLIGYSELLPDLRGRRMHERSFETFPAYIGVALVYLCITMVMSRGVTFMERRLAASDRGK